MLQRQLWLGTRGWALFVARIHIHKKQKNDSPQRSGASKEPQRQYLNSDQRINIPSALPMDGSSVRTLQQMDRGVQALLQEASSLARSRHGTRGLSHDKVSEPAAHWLTLISYLLRVLPMWALRGGRMAISHGTEAWSLIVHVSTFSRIQTGACLHILKTSTWQRRAEDCLQ